MNIKIGKQEIKDGMEVSVKGFPYTIESISREEVTEEGCELVLYLIPPMLEQQTICSDFKKGKSMSAIAKAGQWKIDYVERTIRNGSEFSKST